MKQRIEYFDQMKGIAILLVVFGHIMQFSLGIPKSSLVDMLGLFHMPVFFFTSGYFTYRGALSHKEMAKRCINRTRTLFIPYFIFVCIWAIYAKQDVLNLFAIGGDRYWFLNALFVVSVIYMLYGLLLEKVTNKYLYTLLLFLPIAGFKLANTMNIPLGGQFVCRNLVRLHSILL